MNFLQECSKRSHKQLLCGSPLFFNSHLDQFDVVPSNWSKALVSAVFKNGNKSDPSIYRPISLTSICCKVMEHIFLSHMAKHLSSNNIPSNVQHVVSDSGFLVKLNQYQPYTTGQSQSTLIVKLMFYSSISLKRSIQYPIKDC